MLAYLDPGPPPDSGGGIGPLEVALIVLAVAVVAAGIYWVIRLAVRHERTRAAGD